MSHTTTVGKTTFIHDGGLGGSVQIVQGENSVTVPYNDMRDFIAESLRDELISQIESLPTEAILEIALSGFQNKSDSNR